jgi:hypothetical protein
VDGVRILEVGRGQREPLPNLINCIL